MTDIQALREHLVAEVERAKREADEVRAVADAWTHVGMVAGRFATDARTATDAWLAADTRLRTLDALIALAHVCEL